MLRGLFDPDQGDRIRYNWKQVSGNQIGLDLIPVQVSSPLKAPLANIPLNLLFWIIMEHLQLY
ncbi:MAG: hypothetical protein Ct9H300mP2_4720 [Candidatus Neomarinimicrobiota bacterium]|nr:MAG: hypothetical protein Ct9H300mP2_4720 [Candidatus Neomarinimicrobiota bacterium]